MAQQKSNRCFFNHNILNRLFDYNLRYANNRNEEYDFVNVNSKVRVDEIRVKGLSQEDKRQNAESQEQRLTWLCFDFSFPVKVLWLIFHQFGP